MAAINMLYDELLHPGDVFEKYPSVLKIYDMDVLAVHPDYRGQGRGYRNSSFLLYENR